MTQGSGETLLYVGGIVRALDGGPAHEAIVVRGGRVAGVGPLDEMRTLAGARAREVELEGATLMPGLIDTHPHLLHFGALSFPLVDLSDARDHADIVERIRKRAAQIPPGEWVMTTPVGEPHYFLRRSFRDLAEGELPRRSVLDRATLDHPVFIQAWAPVTPNVCAFNTPGLAAVGITRETPDRVHDVWIEKDAHGEPTGRLHGSVTNYYSNDPFMNALLAKLPLLQPSALVEGTLAAVREYHRLGVTAVYEGHAMGAGEVGVYRHLRERDALRIRVLTALEAESYGLPWTSSLSRAEFRANLELARDTVESGDAWLRCNGVTLSRGGPCWPGLLRMNAPYRGPYGEPTRGVTFVSAEKQEAAARFCAKHGMRLNFIGAGDRDHDEFLDCLDGVLAERPGAARGWILQHAYLVNETQARRYAAAGFDVTTSLSFSWGKGDLMGERIGPHVWNDLIPLRRLLDAGLRVACGSDWGPKNVFEQIALAETHRFAGSGHCNDGPAQKVTREEALLMWTRDAARVLRWKGIGSLRPGDHADAIVVDRDPWRCDLDRLPETRVLRTLVAGETVHDSGDL